MNDSVFFVYTKMYMNLQRFDLYSTGAVVLKKKMLTYYK
jgi:hypothetical protein